MKRLLVDVDEVLCDFQTPVLKVIGDLFGSYLTPEDFTDWSRGICFLMTIRNTSLSGRRSIREV